MYFNSVKWYHKHLSKTRRQTHTASRWRREGVKAEINSGSFSAPPVRQRKALKLEIPATTEWTEREGTCLGRRNCPFSASMHLFTLPLSRRHFLFFMPLTSSFFSIHSSSTVPSRLPSFQFYPFLTCASISQLVAELCQHVCEAFCRRGMLRLWRRGEHAGVQRRS